MEFIQNLNHEILLFIVFNLIVIFLLVLDLGFLSRGSHSHMSFKKALVWTFVWIGVSLAFAGFIYLYDTNPADPGAGKRKAMEFIAAYLLEKSLSVDNLFVFIMIFQSFRIGTDRQANILKWGIIGAVILRAVMILLGAALVAKFHWILYIFGAVLLYTAFKMFFHKEDEESEFDPETHIVYRTLKKMMPLTKNFNGEDFFTRIDGKLFATPMFVVLVLIETSDIVFAFDSIPAVFSVSESPFIVYTSNIFAILGLRALFFMISGIMNLFEHLKTGVSIVLAFVGVKMLLPLVSPYLVGEPIHISINVSLTVILVCLTVSILVSIPGYLRQKEENSK